MGGSATPIFGIAGFISNGYMATTSRRVRFRSMTNNRSVRLGGRGFGAKYGRWVVLGLSLGMVLTAFSLGLTVSGGPIRDAPQRVSVGIVGPDAFPPMHPRIIPHAVSGSSASYGAVINPTGGYSSEPAPMGIADFGVTSGGTAYTYGTPAFLGKYAWTAENYGGSGSQFTVQLNVVLRFVDSGTTYAFWIQDVAEPIDDGSNTLSMSYIDNVWSFSSSSFTLTSSDISGNGTVASAGSSGNYYYDVAAGSLPGESTTIPAPGSFELLVRSYTSTGGEPEVSFEYADPGTAGHFVTYDNVVFKFATAVSSDNGFTVDGTQYTPLGTPLTYSAELDQGGPGGGASTTIANATKADMSIYWFNGDNFESTPGAWNFGGDTGETVSNVQSIGSWSKDGSLRTVQIDGTAKDATPGIAYNPSQVGSVNVSASCSITDGYVAAGATRWYFNGTWAALTLEPGTYHFWANDSSTSDDLGMVTVTAGGKIPVSASTICGGGGGGLSTSVPVPSPTSVDVGQPVTFSTIPSGGSGTYSTYTWSVSNASLGCTLANAASITCVPAAPGSSYTVSVSVTDSSGTKSAVQTSAPFTVLPRPSVTAPIPSITSLEVGQSVTFTTTASGGTGTFPSYTWSSSGPGLGCAASTTPSITCTPTTAGSYTASVTVTDSNGGVSPAATSSSVTVNPGPAVAPPLANPSSITLGQSVTFSTAASGGSGTYSTFAWTESASSLGCSLANAATITCTPTSVGSYTVTVSVTDSNGIQSPAQTSPTFTVTSIPTVTSPVASPSEGEVGLTTVFSTTASGGSGTYSTYTWTPSSNALGCASTTAASISCTPTAAGSAYTISVRVTDSNGATSVDATSATFTVVAQVTTTAPSASATEVELSQSVTFTTTASGGSGTYTNYAWSASAAGLGCAFGNSASITCSPTAIGSTYWVAVEVTDSLGGHSAKIHSANFMVVGAPSVTSFAASPSTILQGQSATLEVVVAGGVGPFTYGYVGLPPGCMSSNTASLSCTPATSGNFTITVTVTDGAGKTASASTRLSVTAAVSNSSPLGAGLPEIFLILIVAAVIAVAILAIVVRRRRLRKDTPAPPPFSPGPFRAPPPATPPSGLSHGTGAQVPPPGPFPPAPPPPPPGAQ